MTLVAYRRLADAPPPERETLEVDEDGTARAWRSNGTAIGRFGGSVTDLAAWKAAVAEVAEAGAAGGSAAVAAGAAGAAGDPPAAALPPGAALETVEAGGRTVRLEARAPVDGPWSNLVERCRKELDALVAEPVAAIAGVLGRDGAFRLEYRGSAALSVELGALAVELVLWRDGAEAARRRLTPDGPGSVDAGPGWTLKLPVPALDLAGGGTLVARASFVAEDGGIYVPVAVSVSVSI